MHPNLPVPDAEELELLRNNQVCSVGITPEEANQAKVNAARLTELLTMEKELKEAGSVSTPFLLDSELLKVSLESQSSNNAQEIKSYGSEIFTVPVQNYVNITISVIKQTSKASMIMNSLIALFDYYFSNANFYANVELYSYENIIQKGFLANLSRTNNKQTGLQEITIKVSKIVGGNAEPSDSPTEIPPIDEDPSDSAG